jgi:asparagine N-glycosylation enzyme membrane subunit Stt3
MSLLFAVIVATLSIIVPGFFLSLALLKRTGLPMFEIAAIGFIFGIIFPPTMIWLESYLIPLSPAFAFSNGLYNINVIVLTLIGIALSVQQGAISSDFIKKTSISSIKFEHEVEKDYKKRIELLRKKISEFNTDIRIIKEHEREELALFEKHKEELSLIGHIGAEERNKIIELHKEEERKLFERHEAEENQLINKPSDKTEKSGNGIIWIALLLIMIITFGTRMLSIGTASTYFQFDPYFDMISTQYILTYGQQLLYDHAAWPSLANGTIHRIQPIIPYLEAYWYNLAGATPSSSSINTTLLANVSSVYPPIIAALLAFVVFMFLYHEYGEYWGLLGAGLTAASPILLSTFIAGNQLLEPFGIFALFFFYGAYLLAVNNPKEPRFAIFAGIAFASNFLGAHYYTVPAGILSFYIILQGLIHLFKKENTIDFYKMNIIVLAVSAFFYALYGPYGATLTERTPNLLGVPVIISFPIAALAFIALIEYIPKLAKEKKLIDRINGFTYIEAIAVLVVIAILAIIFTPLGKPFYSYLSLTKRFTTPSSPLFMTVQEYAPTGINYDFAAGGFGLIGSSIGGVAIIVWAVMIIFTVLEVLAIIRRNSKSSILALAAVWPLAVVGAIEVEYLPHFAVGYIIAIGAIFGELWLMYSTKDEKTKKILLSIGAIVIFVQAVPVFYQIVTAASNPNCNSIAQSGNSLGSILYCTTVPNYWLNATAWMKANVGPYAPRILSWWDYGDWINWFGNSNAVLRGDNSVPLADYQAAAHYVFSASEGFNNTRLANYMNSVQAKYILFDDQLVPKWGALDFLACTYANQTGMQYALSQGKLYGQPYVLGTSPCELRNDPAYIFIPITQSVNSYCQFTSGNVTAIAMKGIVVVGQSGTNTTYCVPETFLQTGAPTYLLSNNGTKTNAIVTSALFGGSTTISGQQFVSFMLIYAPNGPNNTITDAPSQFYNSTYYRGFFLGTLGRGFTMAYPSNFTGINYVNGTNKVVIFELKNYSGTLPYVVPKPSWAENNYSMPG